MNSSGKPVLFALLGVLVLGIFAIVYWLTSITNWDKIYEPDSDYPYGTIVFQRLLQKQSEGFEWQVVEEDLAEALKESPEESASTYAFIGRRMYLDSAEIAEIQDFAYRGNTVFISSERFNSTLLEHVFDGTSISDSSLYEEIEIIDLEIELDEDEWEYEDTESLEYSEDDADEEYYYDDDEYLQDMSIFLHGSPYLDSKQDSMIGVYYSENESVNKRVNIKYKIEHETSITQFNFWNESLSANSIVDYEELGNSTEGACFIRVSHGEGEFLLHTVPLALTNYPLLKEDVFRYNQEVFSHLEASNVIWDESSRKIKPVQRRKSNNSDASASLRDVEEGPLSLILNSAGLKHAWFLMLFLTLLFFVFGSKRKQRIVPVQHPPRNTSIEFAETLGHMFRQQNSHSRMITIKSDLFNDFIFQRYGVRMNGKTEEEQIKHIKLLSAKSGVSKEDLNKLIDQLNSTSDTGETKNRATQLIRVHQLLEEFYRKCK